MTCGFVSSLVVSHLFLFQCFGKSVLRDCDISLVLFYYASRDTNAFEHGHNAQIQIILRMQKISSGPLLSILRNWS